MGKKVLKFGVIALVCLVAIAAVSLALGKRHINNQAEAPVVLESPLILDVASGSSFRKVARELESLGLIRSELEFRIYARLQDNAHLIKTGEYQITSGMSPADILDMLVAGEVVQRSVTFVEGQRLKDYLVELANADGINHRLLNKTPAEIAKLLDIPHDNPEGWFYPDTYHYTKGMDDVQLLKRAYQKMQAVLDEEWPQKADNLPIKTPYEALILASIIEKETGVPYERPAIAGVFVRRLQKNMRLQTDPTIVYGMGEAYDGNIRRKDLLRDTPYNTYTRGGLTPTPIASPGRLAIHAALHPEDGKALYFVAKGDGSHQFSNTLVEHNEAVRQFQKQRVKHYRSSPAPQPVESASQQAE